MRNIFRAILLLFGIPAAISSAAADDCGPLKLLATLKMSPIAGDSRVSIPVAINGTTENLLIDSGAPITTLSDAAAKSLGLVSSPSRVVTIRNGARSEREYKVETFDIGNQRISNFALQENPGALPDGFPVGLFSLDMLRKYEADLDFGALRFNLFSQDHCPARVTYWHERPLAVVPFTIFLGHLFIPVAVDGHQLNAMIDTGSTETWMSAVPAKYVLNLSFGSADTPETGIVTQPAKRGAVSQVLKTYTHVFNSLSFDGVTVTNPKMTIYPDSSFGHGYDNIVTVGLPQVTIGMDVLRDLHVYVAYGERKLYITPAGSGESALFQKVVTHADRGAPAH